MAERGQVKCIPQRWARATCFMSAIAIPELDGSSSATAFPQLFKEMLLHNCIFAIPSSQFFTAVFNFKAAMF
jgi:hypothetical protein